jgi:hypothetical protein
MESGILRTTEGVRQLREEIFAIARQRGISQQNAEPIVRVITSDLVNRDFPDRSNAERFLIAEGLFALVMQEGGWV